MAEARCFQELFSNMIEELKTLDKVKEVSSHFGPDKDLEAMFSYFWGLEEAHHHLKPTILHSAKSDTDAERLRSEGNKFYQRKLLSKALKLYNLSIMASPHPEIVVDTENSTHNYCEGNNNCNTLLCEVIDNSNDNTFRSLSLAYANRSAVLFELKQYDKCISDIGNALRYGYPKLLHSKLAERKAKCLIALQKLNEAKQLLETSIQDLGSLSLDETKIKASRNTLEQLLQQCQQDGKSIGSVDPCSPHSSSNLSSTTKEKLLFCYETPKPPELSPPNSVIPSLSSAVKLAFSSSQGRYLVAERDIKPGEVLVVEEGYSRVLHLDSSLRTHCSGCLARCITPLPCPSCSKVIFCSEACRLEALASYHNQECKVLPALTALDIGKNSVLAYRILIQTSYGQLKDLVPIYFNEALKHSPRTLGFNSSGKYISSDYRTIYHLVTNKGNRSVSDLFKRCAMALILTKLLTESQQFFINSEGQPFSPSHEDIMLTGCTLFVHMMNLPCNAHSITEMKVNVSNYQHSAYHEIGCGAFGVLSLTNHSCNPAAARISYGSVVVLRAIRSIPVGAEVTDCYGEHYGINDVNTRKTNLMQQYYFSCVCDPCNFQWPKYLQLVTEELKLKCLKCSKSIDVHKGQCTYCKLSYTVSGDNVDSEATFFYNWKDINKKVKLALNKYNNAYENIIKGINSLDSQNIICETIELLDKYIQQPCKPYFEAQETLKHCFDRRGSCTFSSE